MCYELRSSEDCDVCTILTDFRISQLLLIKTCMFFIKDPKMLEGLN